jgi:hypothetical protein
VTRSTVITGILILAFGVSFSPGWLEGQNTPDSKARWILDELRTGFCIDFLMDSTAATKQVRKVDKSFLVVPADHYSRLNPALDALVGRRPEFAQWIPASLCIITAGAMTVGGRTVTDDDPDERQMVGFWGIAARPADQLLSDSIMVAPVLFTNNHRIDRNSELDGLKVDTVEEDRGDMPDTPGDRFYHIRVKKTDIHWAGHMAGSPMESEPRRWTLMFKGTKNSSWLADVRLEPEQQQFFVGSLRIQGKDDLAKAMKASPMRMQGPAFWGGAGRFEFYP